MPDNGLLRPAAIGLFVLVAMGVLVFVEWVHSHYQRVQALRQAEPGGDGEVSDQ